MSEEILINVTPQETRIAYVENGVLQEVHIERARRRGLVGNIYKGKVSRVLPGMQAVFVEMGLDRTAFLHESDITAVVDENDTNTNTSDARPKSVDALLRLKEGQDVVVQVIKDPIGSKGARLTTQLSIPSRYLVYIPASDHIGVSQRIEDEQERTRLKNCVISHAEGKYPGGYIIRTVAEGASEAALQSDIEFLHKLWRSVDENIEQAKSESLIYSDLPLVIRTMRDISGTTIEKIRIDSRETFNKAVQFAEEFIPELVDRIEYYPGERPIFDIYGVEDEIRNSLQSKVQLKSGGYLIIDQTEAMTTVDVNTGAYVGHRNLEETIFKTNLEATQTIARQLRLRNLGGIIIIDFIDMVDPEHKRQVLRALEKNLDRDQAKTNISEVSTLGLVQMTRKRTRESLEHILCESCPTCHGRGHIMTAETMCYEIFREILREARQYDAERYLVLASQTVVDRLLDEESTSVAQLETFIGKPIGLQVEAEYTQEQFDVVPM